MIEKLLSEEVQSFIAKHESDDPFQLSLRYKEVNGVPIRLISEQISGRQKAKTKLPTWYSTKDILYPPKLSMEQCSSEITAGYKASVVSGKRFMDLTGGAGVDTWALARFFEIGDHVEQNTHLATLSESNFSALGRKNIEVHNTTAEGYLESISETVDCIYIDPARRDENKNRVFRLEDCTPDIVELLPKLKVKADQILIKASPMMDIDLALKSLEGVSEVHIVAVENDCKEVLYLISQTNADHITLCMVNFKKDRKELLKSTIHKVSAAKASFSAPQNYLYEPNATIMKAGAFAFISEKFSVPKLHTHTHLYTSNKLLTEFPGRAFKIERLLLYSKKEVRKAIPGGKANISTRNFKDDVASIRKKTGLKEGGELYLFGFTDVEGAQCLALCKKV